MTIPIFEEMAGSSTSGNYNISKLYVIDEPSELVASKKLTEQGWTEDNRNYYYYIPNFGLFDHAFFITKDNPALKDEDGVVRFTSFAVTAYDSSEKVIEHYKFTDMKCRRSILSRMLLSCISLDNISFAIPLSPTIIYSTSVDSYH